jgi:hypothetical protein
MRNLTEQKSVRKYVNIALTEAATGSIGESMVKIS